MSKVGVDEGPGHGEHRGHGQGTREGFLNRQLEEPDVSRGKEKSSGISEQSRNKTDARGNERQAHARERHPNFGQRLWLNSVGFFLARPDQKGKTETEH